MKRGVKLLLVAWLLAEFWTRGGRELVLGTSAPATRPDVDEFTITVPLPVGHHHGSEQRRLLVGKNIDAPDGTRVGEILAVYPDYVRAKFRRDLLGWPINVALAQAEDYTRRALGIA